MINNTGRVVVKSNAVIASLGSTGLPQNGTATVIEGAQNIGIVLQDGDNIAVDLALFWNISCKNKRIIFFCF